jgi:hypothetical protein
LTACTLLCCAHSLSLFCLLPADSAGFLSVCNFENAAAPVREVKIHAKTMKIILYPSIGQLRRDMQKGKLEVRVEHAKIIFLFPWRHA